MEKLFGGFLLVVAGILFYYRAWIFGIIVLLIALALIFNWKGRGDADSGDSIDFSSDDSGSD
jgi:hypothetical protein